MPLIEDGCAAWLECRLISEPHTEEAYDTCFVEVVAAAADSRVFAQDGRWSFRADNEALHTLHHLGAGNFARAGNCIQATARYSYLALRPPQHCRGRQDVKITLGVIAEIKGGHWLMMPRLLNRPFSILNSTPSMMPAKTLMLTAPMRSCR